VGPQKGKLPKLPNHNQEVKGEKHCRKDKTQQEANAEADRTKRRQSKNRKQKGNRGKKKKLTRKSVKISRALTKGKGGKERLRYAECKHRRVKKPRVSQEEEITYM